MRAMGDDVDAAGWRNAAMPTRARAFSRVPAGRNRQQNSAVAQGAGLKKADWVEW